MVCQLLKISLYLVALAGKYLLHSNESGYLYDGEATTVPSCFFEESLSLYDTATPGCATPSAKIAWNLNKPSLLVSMIVLRLIVVSSRG